MPAPRLIRIADHEWHLPQDVGMHVPGIVYGSEALVTRLEPGALEQVRDVARLPGIVRASYAMPDAHTGYGFPIGGVAAFDASKGGVVSAGGVGFDIACGVRVLTTGLTRDDLAGREEQLADELFRSVSSGVGQPGPFRLSLEEIDALLSGGARWAVEFGLGEWADLGRLELEEQDGGRMPGAAPQHVSRKAKDRFRDQLGTLGSGNHYLEIQVADRIVDPIVAEVFGVREGDVLVAIHCGSRGLGHQIGTDYLAEMHPGGPARSRKGNKSKRTASPAPVFTGYRPPTPELACAPINSDLGGRYLGAMRAGVNAALANRQAITHLVRGAFNEVMPRAELRTLYDVSHNTCRAERHKVDGKPRTLHVHRKGATRALGPGHPDLPASFREVGQPVLVGGSMGTASALLRGVATAEARSFSSACHGAGRLLSRAAARKLGSGRDIAKSLHHRGVFIRTSSWRGLAEEAPAAYKDVFEVVESTRMAGLAEPVIFLTPLACIKG